jgi:threonine dehydrogenase-like Zn-dependent dehydrogenase
MRAFVVTAPRTASVVEVEAPVAGTGQVVVDVARVGICGTDVEFFTGEMSYLHQGHAAYPMRLGHEWSGTVAAVGTGVDPSWLGRRVTGDTMLGCGHCRLCRDGRTHVCEQRFEIGIRGGWPGALAEQLLVPVSALYALPDAVDFVAGALVEPGGNALRAVDAVCPAPGEPLLICGRGTIGRLAAMIAAARGVRVHLLGHNADQVEGVEGVWTRDTLPPIPFDAVIDATNAAEIPALALDLVQPGGRIASIGLSGDPSLIDTRTLVLKDVTAIGILSASPGLAGTIESYASGRIDPSVIVAATVGLDGVASVLAGKRPPEAGPGPKFHVDPTLRGMPTAVPGLPTV